jgi:hypothetical protein
VAAHEKGKICLRRRSNLSEKLIFVKIVLFVFFLRPCALASLREYWVQKLELTGLSLLLPFQGSPNNIFQIVMRGFPVQPLLDLRIVGNQNRGIALSSCCLFTEVMIMYEKTLEDIMSRVWRNTGFSTGLFMYAKDCFPIVLKMAQCRKEC